MQGLELLVTVLLARNRQPPPPVAAGVPHAELAAELLTLPSGLLAMVCEAIVKLKVRLAACVHCCVGRWRGPTRSRRALSALAFRGGPTVCGVLAVLLAVTPHSSGKLHLRFPMRSRERRGKARAPRMT